MRDTVLKVGITGYGIVGKRRHDVIKQNPDMYVAAVCDRKFNGHGKLDDGVSYYDNYKALLENEALDALIICMTNDIASEVTMAGFNSVPKTRSPLDVAENILMRHVCI